MWNSKLFKAGVGVLMLFLIIYLGKQISFIFQPFIIAIEALFFSFFIAGILFYLTSPLAELLYNRKVPRPLAISAIFLLIAGLLVLLFFTIGPVLQYEFTKLALSVPGQIMELRNLIRDFEDHRLISQILDLQNVNIEEMVENISSTLSSILAQMVTSFTSIIDFAAGIFMTIVIVPFLLYYMLKEKDSDIISSLVHKVVPEDYEDKTLSALAEMNKLLGSYVQGLGIVCLCVGILAYIGFVLIGLEYALILSIFILITNIVPFLGPFIGAIPAVIVGLLHSPFMTLKVIIIIVIVQQIESLLISPQVMGRKLSLSPLSIILIVLVAGRLGGLLGIILAIPIFTVMKIIIAHIYEYLKLGKPIKESLTADGEKN